MIRPDVVFDYDPTYSEDYPTVYRCMAFADVAGFTSYTHKSGTHAAARLLELFRSQVRATTGRHAIRVAKWLGDGVMLVGTDSPSVLAALTELVTTARDHGYEIHCGASAGQVIIFEGDDYLGRIVNIAARLCDNAKPNHILTYQIKPEIITPYDPQYESCHLRLKGIGEITGVLEINPAYSAAFASTGAPTASGSKRTPPASSPATEDQ